MRTILPQITNLTISLLFSRSILVRSANSSYLPHFVSHIYQLSCEPSSSQAKLWCYRILWRKLVVIEAIRTTHPRQIDTLKWTVRHVYFYTSQLLSIISHSIRILLHLSTPLNYSLHYIIIISQHVHLRL